MCYLFATDDLLWPSTPFPYENTKSGRTRLSFLFNCPQKFTVLLFYSVMWKIIPESIEGKMASKNRRDVVARLVSKKLRSRTYLRPCSSSEEDNDCKVEEEDVESFENIQEKAGRCKHGPPTDYPCHLCCHQKWASTRRLDQPLMVERVKGRNGIVIHKIGVEQLSEGEIAGEVKSKEKKREHSEENRGDILFDGISVGPKTKKANSGMKIDGKNYGFNVPPGVTITAGGSLKSKTSSTSKSTPNEDLITHISTKDAPITPRDPLKANIPPIFKELPNIPISRKEKDPGVTITAGGLSIKSNNSSTAKEVLFSSKEAGLYEEQEQLVEIVKKTNWAEVFRMAGVSIPGNPVPAPSSQDEVICGTVVLSPQSYFR